MTTDDEQGTISTSIDASALAKMVQEFLNETAPVIKSNGTFAWKASDGMYPLVIRAMLVRQDEFLRAILALNSADFGFAGVVMLRPACEELIWLRYLKTMTVEQANLLVKAKSQLEIADALVSQKEFSGLNAVQSLRLPHYSASALRGEAEATLGVLAAELKWKVSKNIKLPSVAFVARKAKSLALYKFMYFATSKFVHFSPHELARRCWGKPGNISVGSNTFGNYWSAFALRWGLQLYIETLIEGLETTDQEHGPQLDEKRVWEIAERVRDFGKIPIITAEELDWPF